MSEFFDWIIKYQGLFSLIIMVISTLLLSLNYVNVTRIEKILMTYRKRFLLALSQIFIISILFSIALIITSYVIDNETFKDLTGKDFILFIAFFMGMVFLFIGSLYLILAGLFNLVTIQYRYYVIYKGQKWKIHRFNGNNLVIERNEILAFINNCYECEYHKEVSSGELKVNFYRNTLSEKNIITTIIISLILLFLILVLLPDQVLVLSIYLIFLVIEMFVFASYSEYYRKPYTP